MGNRFFRRKFIKIIQCDKAKNNSPTHAEPDITEIIEEYKEYDTGAYIDRQ
jgi:hypothetical protein